MKIFYVASVALITIICLSSCKKYKVTPSGNNSRADTSTTLIDNTALVGTWNIVTDTISSDGSSIMYHGVTGDHYIFTKYGNLYINEGLNSYVDTAIYGINSLNYSVAWENLYQSVNGASNRVLTSSSPYSITSVDTVSLVLTADTKSAGGTPRYEQIVFKKMK